jgi:hypothetical protein
VESPGDVDGVVVDESVAVVGVVSSVVVLSVWAIDSGNSNHHAPKCIIRNHSIYSDVMESKGVAKGMEDEVKRKIGKEKIVMRLKKKRKGKKGGHL